MSVASTIRTSGSAAGMPEAHYTSDLSAATSMLPTLTEAVVKSLLNVNRGEPGANMTTIGLVMAVTNKEAYILKGGKLDATEGRTTFSIDLETKASDLSRIIESPPYLEIEATWDDKTLSSGSGSNILGDNGRLILEHSLIEIPAVEATDALLGYYGATLIEEGDLIEFPDNEFPLFFMEVGERYVEDTLMTDAGGGFYLEYHHDKPHFHLPLAGSGHYRIPDGKAVYTKKGAIHCDAGLKGKLLVGYTLAEDCSTVLLQNKTSKRVEVRFIEPAKAAGFPLGAVKA
ncbi:MAG: hypothetical protein NTX49_06820 [Chlamydiae bacterium]|nr:hypothetical protein [Chlamydiota bacterium]